MNDRIGPIDAAIVLGSGLAAALAGKTDFERIPYADLPDVPAARLAGHAGEALVGTWHGKRVVAFAGRVHLYQGFSAAQVTFNVRIAAACGAKAMLLTNAAGGLNPSFASGDVMLIGDHLNLTGANPLIGADDENPFVDMLDAYDPQLRAIARASDWGGKVMHEGVYAGLAGPSYETPAEARYLRGIGADAVGMSTVLETLLARRHGMRVLGLSSITNVLGGSQTSHEDVTRVARGAAARIADILDGVIAAL